MIPVASNNGREASNVGGLAREAENEKSLVGHERGATVFVDPYLRFPAPFAEHLARPGEAQVFPDRPRNLVERHVDPEHPGPYAVTPQSFVGEFARLPGAAEARGRHDHPPQSQLLPGPTGGVLGPLSETGASQSTAATLRQGEQRGALHLRARDQLGVVRVDEGEVYGREAVDRLETCG